MVGGQDIASEQQTYSLPFWLCGEEGSEEVLSYVGRYAASVVCDNESPPSPLLGEVCGDADAAFTEALHTLNTVLDDIDEHLLEEDGIQVNGNGFISELEVQTNTCTVAQILQEGTAGIHFLAEVAELKLWLWNLHHIGKAGDKGRKCFESFGQWFPHFPLPVFHDANRSCHAIVHFMCNHADNSLVCCLLSSVYLFGKGFNEEEGMLVASVGEGQVADAVELWSA